jgi:hypothetical protein
MLALVMCLWSSEVEPSSCPLDTARPEGTPLDTARPEDTTLDILADSDQDIGLDTALDTGEAFGRDSTQGD